MSEIIIIGNGPAGVSAALYTARSGIKTKIIGKDSGSLIKAEKIENYYGFSSPVSGAELIEAGIAQAKRVGVEIINEEVVGINFAENFSVTTNKGEYPADSVIIATGSPRFAPKISGLTEFEGKGVSYCAVCDAFFYRGKNVAVIGNGEYALHEAEDLLPVVNSVLILTDGAEPAINFPGNIKVISEKISSLEGNERLENVKFENGDFLKIDGVFIAYGVAGSVALARKIGAVIDKNKIIVDENMSTNIPGIFAAGDCTGGMIQVAKAVYEGAKAGTEAVKYLRNKSKAE